MWRALPFVALFVVGCGADTSSSPPTIQDGPIPVDVPVEGLMGRAIEVDTLSLGNRSTVSASVALAVPRTETECPVLQNPDEWSLVVNDELEPLESTGGVAQYAPTPGGYWWGSNNVWRTWHCRTISSRFHLPVPFETDEPLRLGIRHLDDEIVLEVDDVFQARRFSWPGPAVLSRGEMTVVEYEGPALDPLLAPPSSAVAWLKAGYEPQDFMAQWDVVVLDEHRYGLVVPDDAPLGEYSVSGGVTVGLPVRCTREDACLTPALRPPHEDKVVIHVEFSYAITVED